MKFPAAVLMLLVSTSSAFAQVTAVEYLKANPEAVAKYIAECDVRMNAHRDELTKRRADLVTLNDELKATSKIPIRQLGMNKIAAKTGKIISFNSLSERQEAIELIKARIESNRSLTARVEGWIEADEVNLKQGKSDIAHGTLRAECDKWDVGMIGRIGHGDIFQIIDADNALLQTRKHGGGFLSAWIQMPTKGIRTGTKIKSPLVFVVTGTKTYTSKNGEQTVIVAAALPEDFGWRAKAVPADPKPTTDEKDK